jgi:hypothetical protein
MILVEVKIGTFDFKKKVDKAKRAALEAARFTSRRVVAQSFSNSVDPDGHHWANKSNGMQCILVKSGTMFLRFTYTLTGDSLYIVNRTPYARIHQNGASVRRGKGRIPRRAMLPETGLGYSRWKVVVQAMHAAFHKSMGRK